MRRLCLLLAFAGGPGCVSDTGTGPFDAALKDLRGDNMQMRSSGPGMLDPWDQPAKPKPAADRTRD
jgi:hypothetical protein